jgi:hypothetical protein
LLKSGSCAAATPRNNKQSVVHENLRMTHLNRSKQFY